MALQIFKFENLNLKIYEWIERGNGWLKRVLKQI